MEKTIVEACATDVNKTVVMADHKVALHIPSGFNDAHPDGASGGASPVLVIPTISHPHSLPRFAIPPCICLSFVIL